MHGVGGTVQADQAVTFRIPDSQAPALVILEICVENNKILSAAPESN